MAGLLEDDADSITEQEMDIMKKRRDYILNYTPPIWTSSAPDPVSGSKLEVSMVTRASKWLVNYCLDLFNV